MLSEVQSRSFGERENLPHKSVWIGGGKGEVLLRHWMKSDVPDQTSVTIVQITPIVKQITGRASNIPMDFIILEKMLGCSIIFF
ncbi:MAG: hypothetical protein Fur0022_31250 [Anaerolineales bacterium]